MTLSIRLRPKQTAWLRRVRKLLNMPDPASKAPPMMPATLSRTDNHQSIKIENPVPIYRERGFFVDLLSVSLVRCPGIVTFISIHKYAAIQLDGFDRFRGFNNHNRLFLI